MAGSSSSGTVRRICPAVFVLLEDGLAYVKQDGAPLSAPGVAEVPTGSEDAVSEAGEECPGECISIEP